MTMPADLGLRGRKVLVTGGGRGIGRACVELFANLGCAVRFTYLRDDRSADALVASAGKDGRDVAALRLDAAEAGAYDRLAEEIAGSLGGLDILVNNVGDAIRRSSFAQSDDQLWVDSLNLNLLSAVRAVRVLRPLLLASDAGVVVNISSIAAFTTGAGDSLHYGVAKAALNTFTTGLAREFAGTRMRAVGVAPSAIDTDFQARHSSPERLEKIVAQTPVGRVGSAGEVAWTVAMLASPLSAYVSGAVLPVTGGR